MVARIHRRRAATMVDPRGDSVSSRELVKLVRQKRHERDPRLLKRRLSEICSYVRSSSIKVRKNGLICLARHYKLNPTASGEDLSCRGMLPYIVEALRYAHRNGRAKYRNRCLSLLRRASESYTGRRWIACNIKASLLVDMLSARIPGNAGNDVFTIVHCIAKESNRVTRNKNTGITEEVIDQFCDFSTIPTECYRHATKALYRILSSPQARRHFIIKRNALSTLYDLMSWHDIEVCANALTALLYVVRDHRNHAALTTTSFLNAFSDFLDSWHSDCRKWAMSVFAYLTANPANGNLISCFGDLDCFIGASCSTDAYYRRVTGECLYNLSKLPANFAALTSPTFITTALVLMDVDLWSTDFCGYIQVTGFFHNICLHDSTTKALLPLLVSNGLLNRIIQVLVDDKYRRYEEIVSILKYLGDHKSTCQQLLQHPQYSSVSTFLGKHDSQQ